MRIEALNYTLTGFSFSSAVNCIFASVTYNQLNQVELGHRFSQISTDICTDKLAVFRLIPQGFLEDEILNPIQAFCSEN